MWICLRNPFVEWNQQVLGSFKDDQINPRIDYSHTKYVIPTNYDHLI